MTRTSNSVLEAISRRRFIAWAVAMALLAAPALGPSDATASDSGNSSTAPNLMETDSTCPEGMTAASGVVLAVTRSWGAGLETLAATGLERAPLAVLSILGAWDRTYLIGVIGASGEVERYTSVREDVTKYPGDKPTWSPGTIISRCLHLDGPSDEAAGVRVSRLQPFSGSPAQTLLLAVLIAAFVAGWRVVGVRLTPEPTNSLAAQVAWLLTLLAVTLVAAGASAVRSQTSTEWWGLPERLLTSVFWTREVALAVAIALGYLSIRHARDANSHRIAFFAAVALTISASANILAQRFNWYWNSWQDPSVPAAIDSTGVAAALLHAQLNVLWAVPLVALLNLGVTWARRAGPSPIFAAPQALLWLALIATLWTTETWRTALANSEPGHQLLAEPEVWPDRMPVRAPVRGWRGAPAPFPHHTAVPRVIDATLLRRPSDGHGTIPTQFLGAERRPVVPGNDAQAD